ncbi:hypothetical protein D3C78_1415130 [compost metagenome]
MSSKGGNIKFEHDTGTFFEISADGSSIKMFHKSAGEIRITNNGMTADILGNINLTTNAQVNVTGTSYNFI